MYGLIGNFTAHPGKRDALIGLLAAGSEAMPGCISYVIATDPGDPDRIWVTELWTDAASHRASLSLPQVQQAIIAARPLIAGFGAQVVTHPVAGTGI